MSKNSCVRVSWLAGFISFRHDANDHICRISASCAQLRMPPYLSTAENRHPLTANATQFNHERMLA